MFGMTKPALSGKVAAAAFLALSLAIAGWILLTTVAVSGQESAPPAAPTGLSATVNNGSATLSWNTPSSAAGITKHQYRHRAGSGDFIAWTDISDSAPGGANANSFKVAGLTNGSSYTFNLRAVNGSGAGPYHSVIARPTWHGTMTVGAQTGGWPRGWGNASYIGATLTYDTQLGDIFPPIYLGEIRLVNSGTLTLHFGYGSDTTPATCAAIRTDLAGWYFNVGDTFSREINSLTCVLGSGGTRTAVTATWTNAGLTWAAADSVALSITKGTSPAVLTFPDAPAGLTARIAGGAPTLEWAPPATTTPLTYQLYQVGRSPQLAASDPVAGASLGSAVAVDGNTMVAGAPGNAASPGAAYVFTNANGQWQPTAKLTASDGANGDKFGHSVSIDGNAIIVGAPGHDSGSSADAGAAYVFAKPSAGWTATTTALKLSPTPLQPSHNIVNGAFGHSVSIRGSVIAVGAPASNSTVAGSVYIFTRPSANSAAWTQQNRVPAAPGTNDRNYGWAVAVASSNSIMVGEPGAMPSDSTFKGALHVLTSNNWPFSISTSAQPIRPAGADSTAGDHFGISLGVNAAADTVVVGASGTSSTPGAAFAIVKTGSNWNSTLKIAKLTASDRANNDRFGASVAIHGANIVVGANGASARQGAAYLFSKPAAGWSPETETAKLVARQPASQDEFGTAVALSDAAVIIGANGVNNGALSDAGALYPYRYQPWTPIPDSSVTTTSHPLTGLYNGAQNTLLLRAAHADRPGPHASAQVNRPPQFAPGASTARSIAAGAPAGASIGRPLNIIDPDGDTRSIVLTGSAACQSAFALNSASGQLTARTALTQSSHTCTVRATDQLGAAANLTVTVSITAAPSGTPSGNNDDAGDEDDEPSGGGGGGGSAPAPASTPEPTTAPTPGPSPTPGPTPEPPPTTPEILALYDANPQEAAEKIGELADSNPEQAADLIVAISNDDAAVAGDIISRALDGHAPSIGEALERAAGADPNAVTNALRTISDDPDAVAKLSDYIPVETWLPEQTPQEGDDPNGGGTWQDVGSPAPVENVLALFETPIQGAKTNIVNHETQPANTAELPPGQTPYAFVDITHENFDSDDLVTAHTTLSVEKDWLSSNQIHQWSVQFTRYEPATAAWTPTSVKRVSEDDDKVYFSVTVPGFSLWAITGETEAPAVVFIENNLRISETALAPGQPAVVSVDVTNQSDAPATYFANLWLNGQINRTAQLDIAAGITETVNMTFVSDTPGSYTVRIGSQIATAPVVVGTPRPLAVTATPAPANPTTQAPTPAPTTPPAQSPTPTPALSPPLVAIPSTPIPAAAAIQQPAIAPEPEPAAIGSITFSNPNPDPGNPVMMQFPITNRGSAVAEYELVIEVAGEAVQQQTVTVPPGETLDLRLPIIAPDDLSQVTVRVGEQSKTTSIAPARAAPGNVTKSETQIAATPDDIEPNGGAPWLLIGIAAVIILAIAGGGATILLRRRR